MQNRFTLIIALALLWVLPQPDCTADDTETSTILGGWKVIKMKSEGKPVSEASWRGMRWEFKKGTYTMWSGTSTPAGIAGKPPLQGPYSIDNESDPHHFNFTMIRGESRRDVEAIYKIADEKLYICLEKDGRAKSFDTEGTKNLCYVLERLPTPDEN